MRRLFPTRRDRQDDDCRLQAESLESRTLLAGVVFAGVDTDGTLFIIGDAAANAILVSTFEDPVNGTGFRIEGLIKNGPTFVNGGLSDEFFGVAHLDAALFGGDDYFAMTNDYVTMLACLDGTSETQPLNDVFIPGRAVIDVGDGVNQVDLGSVTTNLQLLIEGGAQDDLVRLCGADVGSNLTVRTFGGADGVEIHNSFVFNATNIRTANGNSDVAIDGLDTGDLFVYGGNHQDDMSFNALSVVDDMTLQGYLGHDVVDTSNADSFPWGVVVPEVSTIGDRLAIRTGDGQGTVDIRLLDSGMISVIGGSGTDFVGMFSVFTERNVYVSTLGGQGTVDFEELFVNTHLSVVLGSVGDSLFVLNSAVGTNATFNALGGSDVVDIENLEVENNLYAYMGDGDDDLFVNATSATNAYLYGGSDHDRYFAGINTFGSENVFQFEETP